MNASICNFLASTQVQNLEAVALQSGKTAETHICNSVQKVHIQQLQMSAVRCKFHGFVREKFTVPQVELFLQE
jgi:hypothetical protein